jgi:hypothetical protein
MPTIWEHSTQMLITSLYCPVNYMLLLSALHSILLLHMHLKPDSNVEEALKIGPGSVGKKYQNPTMLIERRVSQHIMHLP